MDQSATPPCGSASAVKLRKPADSTSAAVTVVAMEMETAGGAKDGGKG